MAGVIVGAVIGGAYTTLDAQPKQFTVYGQGTVSCGGWVRNTQGDSASKYPLSGWVNGFVSGVGWTGQTLKETEADAMQLFVTNYCNANPLDEVVNATVALVRALRQQ